MRKGRVGSGKHPARWCEEWGTTWGAVSSEQSPRLGGWEVVERGHTYKIRNVSYSIVSFLATVM